MDEPSSETPGRVDEGGQSVHSIAESDGDNASHISIGEVVIVVGEDGTLYERKVAERSTRSYKRQTQLIYRVQPVQPLPRKTKQEWVEASKVQKRTPELLEKMKKAMKAQEEEQAARLKEELALAKRREEARKQYTGRLPTWWEMVAEAVVHMDKDDKGVSLEDMQKYVEATFQMQGKNAQKQLANTVSAGVTMNHLIEEDGLYKLAPSAKLPGGVGGRSSDKENGGSKKSDAEGGDEQADEDDEKNDGDSVRTGGSGTRRSSRRSSPSVASQSARQVDPSVPARRPDASGRNGLGKAPYPVVDGPGIPPHHPQPWNTPYPGAPPYYHPQGPYGATAPGGYRPHGPRDSLGALRAASEDAMSFGETPHYRAFFQTGGLPPSGRMVGPGAQPVDPLAELRRLEEHRKAGASQEQLQEYQNQAMAALHHKQAAGGVDMYGRRYPPPPPPGGLPAGPMPAYERDMAGRPGTFRLPGVVYDHMGYPQGSIGPMGLLEQSRALPREDYPRMGQAHMVVGSLASAVMSGPPGLNSHDDDDDLSKSDEAARRREEREEAARNKAAAAKRRREEDAAAREQEDEEERRREEEEQQLKLFRRSGYELKNIRKKITIMTEGLSKLKAERRLLQADLAEAERKLNVRQSRWENKEIRAAEEFKTVTIPDDLDVIASDTRRRNMLKQPPMPEPQVLSCPELPPRSMADLLHVWDFVKAHAFALGVEPFPLLHLVLALGLDEGSLAREMRVLVPVGNRNLMEPGEPGPHFIKEYVVSFLRTIFFRDPRSGEPLSPTTIAGWVGRSMELGVSDKWREVMGLWGEVLNPLTVSAILRKYLVYYHPKDSETDDLMASILEDCPSQFSPYGESFLSEEVTLEAGTEAMKLLGVDELPADQALSIMRHLCDDLLDRPIVQDFIATRTDYLINEITPQLVEAEREHRRAKKELNKATAAAKEAAATSGKELEAVLAENTQIKSLTDRLKGAADQLAKAQVMYEEADKSLKRVKLQPLGEDRFRNQYWYMADEPRVFVHLKSMNVTGLVIPVGFNKKLCPPARPLGGEWGVYTDEVTLKQLIDSLNTKGLREGLLHRRLLDIYDPVCKAMQRALKMRELYNPPPARLLPIDGGLDKSQGSVEGDASDQASRKSQRSRKSTGEDDEEASMEISTVAEEGRGGATGSAVKAEEDGGAPLDESTSVVSDMKVNDVAAASTEAEGLPPPPDKTRRGRSQTSVGAASSASGGEGGSEAAMDDAPPPSETGQDASALTIPPPEKTRRGRSQGGGPGPCGRKYVAMKRPYLVLFEETGDPLECFKKEMLSIEVEVWDAIQSSTLLRMCTNGSREHRRIWQGSVTHVVNALQLIEPLLQLEAFFAQALGFDCPIDEALKLYNALPSKKKKKPEEGRKKRRGRRPKAQPPKRRSTPGVSHKKKVQPPPPPAPDQQVPLRAPPPPPSSSSEEEEPLGEQQLPPPSSEAKAAAEEGAAVKEDDDMEVDKAVSEAADENGEENAAPEEARSSDEEDEEADDEEEEEGEEDEDDDDDEEEEEEEEEDDGAEEEEEGAADDVKAGGRSSVGQKRGKAGGKKAGRPSKKRKGGEGAAVSATAAADGTNGAKEGEATDLDSGVAEANLRSEEDQKTMKEKLLITGPLSSVGRDVWRSELQECKTSSEVALCLYAFSRRAQDELPRLRRRVNDVTAHERAAKESVRSGESGVQLTLPTTECLNVVWAKLPKGPFWPALVHHPYSRTLRRLLREKEQHVLRFIGETPIYHINKAELLPFLNEQGALSTDTRGRGKAMDKALKVAHELWARQMERQKETGGAPEGDERVDDVDDEETEDELEPRNRTRTSLSSTDTEGEQDKYPRKRTTRGAPVRGRRSAAPAPVAAAEASDNGNTTGTAVGARGRRRRST